MIKIKDTNIYLTRGDTAYVTLVITDGAGNPVPLTAQDTIRCQVREKHNGGTLLFEGVIEQSNDTVVWHIRPEDTADVDLEDRTYLDFVWDAQIEYSTGDIFTFIPVSTFRVLHEVTEVE